MLQLAWLLTLDVATMSKNTDGVSLSQTESHLSGGMKWNLAFSGGRIVFEVV